ncbi:MAG TPA: pilus assembly protein TadG-related protein [Acidimicrobiales bacterium]|nr:pilus assembly protein TadG-related protein [Acidimicrobiales bacterium]
MKRLRLRQTRDRGAIVPIVALLLPVLLVMTAFAVDLGRQRSSRRDMQAAADVISLDMSRLANGRTLDEITAGDSLFPPAETALTESATRNGVERSQLTLIWGIWDETTRVFQPVALGTEIPDAAKIVATETTDYYFQPGEGSVTREAISEYGSDAHAGFSVGSFAASMSNEDAVLLDEMLSPYIDDDNPVVIDAPVELDAAHYQGLALADVRLEDLAVELGALTPGELLDTTITLEDLMIATAAVLQREGKVAEAQLVNDSITATMDTLTVRIGDYVNVEPGAEGSAMAATIDLPTVIAGSVYQARCGTDPLGFPDCTALTIPGLTTTLPLTSSSASVKIIESPRYHFGPVGTGTETSQLQLTLNAVAGSQHVGNCVPSVANLACTLRGLVVNTVDAEVTVNATITSAGGRTTIADINCDDPAALGLGLQSVTDLYDIDLVVTVKFGKRGILGGLLGTVFGNMTLIGDTANLGGVDDVQFTVAPDVLGETVRSTGQPEVGLAPLSLTSNGTAQGVIDDLAYLGINYTLGDLVDRLVNPLLAEIDQRVVRPLSRQLGMTVAGSDLTPWAIDCDPGFVELVH